MGRTRVLLIAVLFLGLTAVSCSTTRIPGAWIERKTPHNDVFYSVNFVSDKIGWLNGQADRNYEPAEGEGDGNSNSNSNSNSNRSGPTGRSSTANANKQDPLKANQGFEVLQTTDGGESWTELPGLFANKIRSVWFANQTAGWALTIDRDILHTTDGGASWSLQRKAGVVKLKLFGNLRTPEMDQPEQTDHIFFIDANHGWVWGGGRKDQYTEQPGTFLVTSNGGTNWNEVSYPFENAIASVSFRDAQHGWASVAGGSLYKSVDGGLNWTKVQATLPEQTFNSICFVDDTQGWVVGGRSGRIARSTDGGRTWKRMVQIRDEFRMQSITFLDRDHGWAVGFTTGTPEQRTVLYTPDAGDTWLSLNFGDGKLMDLRFVDKHTAWATGLGGGVLNYQAGG